MLPTAPQKTAVRAPRSGVIQALNARDFGDASALLGAGRMTAEDQIDPRVGIELNVKVGDTIQEGAPIAWLWHDTRGVEIAQEKVLAACQIGDAPTARLPLMIERVSVTGATPYTSPLSTR
jgi:thymidine phosphorylase